MKSSELTRYDPATGRVVNKLTVPGEEVQQYLDLDPYLVEGEADFLTDYVLNKVITHRPANPAVLTGKALTALPIPCTIKINKIAYDCKDDHADLNFVYPGTYTIVIVAFPFLDATFTVTL